MADAADLKSAGGDTVWVRPPPALYIAFLGQIWLDTPYIGGIRHDYFLESPLCVEFLQDTLRISLFSIQQKLTSRLGDFSFIVHI